MITTIFIAILFLGAIGAFAYSFRAQPRGYWIAGSAGTAVLAFLVLFLSMATVVSTRNVGIVTTYGKPNGELSNVFHWVAPWQDVTEMDGAIQLQKFEGKDAITCRLANNSTASANVTMQWRLAPSSAPSLFMDYRTFEGIRENLVDKELSVAMNAECSKFDPLSPDASDGAPLVAMSQKVETDVQKSVGSRIEIQKVFVPMLTYDQQTQERINALNVEKANTRVAEQSKQTAQATSDANKILSQSVSNDPNVISNNCITTRTAKGLDVAGCWPLPGNGQTVVTVPTK